MLDIDKNKVFIGESDRLPQWEKNALNKIRVLLKNYLELDNVSLLFGAGSSIHLGSISIANIPKVFEDELKKIANRTPDGADEQAYQEFIQIIKELQGSQDLIRTSDDPESPIKYQVEGLLNYLNALQFVSDQNPKLCSLEYLDEIITSIKKTLFELCDLDNLTATKSENKYNYHERLVKKVLQRPLNLKRANIFTTNYDLAFENAFDNLGVNYIDGFSGFQNRTFKPETYDYDIYYPGSTTQGKVSRIEKVIRYYKMHGSLTWVKTPASSANIYGIKEYPIDLIRKLKDEPNQTLIGDIMIYPSATKKSYTLDFPYSELFRQFASAITQSQSVLFTYGYSFSDDHINDIIFQALSIPSFTLIVVDYLGTKNVNINKLRELNDPRIIILEGSQLGDFLYFTQYVMPDLVELNTDELVAATMNKIYSSEDDNRDGDEGTQSEDNTVIGVGQSIEPVQETPPNIELPDEDDLPF